MQSRSSLLNSSYALPRVCNRLFSSTAETPLIKPDDLNALADLLGERKKIVLVTGAGVSTESGLSDYRSPNGAYSKGYKPTTYHEFVSKDISRKRYWARSMLAWNNFINYRPNQSHYSLQKIASFFPSSPLITQNVDRLHHKAGSKNITELHGNIHSVQCLSCHSSLSREDYQKHLFNRNPDWRNRVYDQDPYMKRPDGDTELGNVEYETFSVPPCFECGGMMKPTVVFFGENVHKSVVDEATEKVLQAEAMLVCGTSLSVYSIFRLIKLAHEKNIPIAILNLGQTRGDSLAALKIEASTGLLLPMLAAKLEKKMKPVSS